MRPQQVEKIIKKAKCISIDCDGPLMKLFGGRIWLAREKGSKRKNQSKVLSLLNSLENKWMVFIQLYKPPMEGSLEILNSWKKSGKKLCLLTSRYSHIIPATEKWLEKHQFYSLFFRKHYNLQRKIPWIFKEDIIRKENIDFHIDDDPKTIQYLSRALPNKFFIYFNHYLNKPVKGKNIITKYSWKEMEPGNA